MREHRRSPARSLGQQKGIITPQLSCELCRKGKVKCDKLNSCTNCASTGTACIPIYRTRLPWGRHANRPRRVSSPPPPTTRPGETERGSQPTVPVNEDLQERIHRLEALVQGMRSTRMPSAGSQEQVRQQPPRPVHPRGMLTVTSISRSIYPKQLRSHRLRWILPF